MKSMGAAFAVGTMNGIHEGDNCMTGSRTAMQPLL